MGLLEKEVLPRAFFARSHVTWSPSRQSRGTATCLKRLRLSGLFTDSLFSLPSPCTASSRPSRSMPFGDVSETTGLRDQEP